MKSEFASAKSAEIEAIRSRWQRAAIEAQIERGLCDIRLRKQVANKEGVIVQGFKPFWRNVPDDQLAEVLVVLRTYERQKTTKAKRKPD